MEKTFKVGKMHCGSCEMLICDAVSEIKGVRKVSADHVTGSVSLSYDDASVLDKVKKAIEKEGYLVID